MKKFFVKIKDFFAKHLPSKRKLIQLYSALLFNCYVKGYISGDIFKGVTKNVCTPGLNCYSCPGAATACPLGALQNAFADSGKTAPYYMLGIIMLYGVLLGRWICGWLCPFGFIQELLYKIKTPKLKKNPVTKVLSYLKYPILILFVVVLPLIYMLRDFPLPAFCKYICPAGTLGGAVGLLINPANADKFGMLGFLFTWKFVLMVSIIVGCVFIYRMFCRFLCPLGALYGLFNRIAIFGIRLEKKSCISCGKCIETCKMDISRVGDMECISCGECIPVCPTKAISFKGGSIILPPNEIERGIEKLLVTEPELDESEAREKIENKRQKRVAVITAVVTGLLVLILGLGIIYTNFIYKPAAIEPSGDSSESEGNESGDPSDNDGSDEGVADAVAGNELGNIAPSMKLELVLSEGVLSVEELRGKVVVINFWGTWCGPCKAELPHFEELSKIYDGSAEFYIVHTVNTKDEAAEYINTNFPESNMNWVFDKPLSGEIDLYYTMLGGSSYYPRTVVLDENGIITFIKDGSISYESLDEEIRKAGGETIEEKSDNFNITPIVIIDIVTAALIAVGTALAAYFATVKKTKSKANNAESSNEQSTESKEQ